MVDNLSYAQTPYTGTAPFNVQQFQLEHPKSVAFATANASWLKVSAEAERRPRRRCPQRQSDPGDPGCLPEGSPPDVYQKTLANAATLKTLVVPYQTQLGYLAAHQNQLESLLSGVAEVPQAVAALVLGVPRGHGPVHPDHLAREGPVEPEDGPPGRDQARGRRRPRSCAKLVGSGASVTA